MTLRLPVVSQHEIGVKPIDLSGLPGKFMHPGELEILCALVESVRPISVLEIGVNEGRTATALLRNVSSIAYYVGVDVEKGYIPSKTVQRFEVPEQPAHYAFRFYPGKFQLVLKPRGSLDLERDDLPEFDAVFIDGDHGWDAVHRDTWLAQKVVKSGGIIIWHDYHDLGTVDVRDVLHAIYDEGIPIYHVQGSWIAFMRVK